MIVYSVWGQTIRHTMELLLTDKPVFQVDYAVLRVLLLLTTTPVQSRLMIFWSAGVLIPASPQDFDM